MKQISINGTLCYEHQCGTCGVWFALPCVIYDRCKREGGYFSCPNGHSRGWEEGRTPSDFDRLRRERDRLNQRVAERNDEIAALGRSITAHKGQITKLRKRAKAGVCPCCNRQFQNLKRHMDTKHPDYSPEAPELEVVEGGKSA